MAVELWDGFGATLKIDLRRGDRPLPKPTPEALDRYERETGFKFPESYREWLAALGPGEFVENFVLHAPGYPPSYRRIRLENLDENYDNVRTIEEKYLRSSADPSREDPDRARRLRPFCRTHGGETIGWDPEEVTDPDRHECAVYQLERDFTLTRLAPSFRGFVEDYIYGPGYEARVGGWKERTFGPRRKFTPATE